MSRYTNNGVVTVAGQDSGEKSNLWISLLPFIEQDNLYKQSNGPNPRNPSIDVAATAPQALGSRVVNIYLCPSDANNKPNSTWTNGWVVANYVANHDAFHNPNDGGWMSAWDSGQNSYTATFASYTDGSSNTLGVTEAYGCGSQAPVGAKQSPRMARHVQRLERCGAASSSGQPTRQLQRLPPQQIHTSGINALMMTAASESVSVDPNACGPPLPQTAGP